MAEPTMRMTLFALLLVFAGLSLAPDAKGATARELMLQCEGAQKDAKDVNLTDVLNGGLCLGYIDGYVSALSATADTLSLSTSVVKYHFNFSPDGKINLGQISRIFILYMKNHPEKENDDAAVWLTESLIEKRLLTYEHVK